MCFCTDILPLGYVLENTNGGSSFLDGAKPFQNQGRTFFIQGKTYKLAVNLTKIDCQFT